MRHQRLAPAVALIGLVLVGCEKKAPEVELKTPAQQASYGIGLNMGRSMSEEGAELDPQAVALGIKDALAKKDPRVSEQDMMKAFAALQEEAQQRLVKIAEETRVAGEKYLAENAKREGVKVTASGLQYEVLKASETGERPTVDDVVTVHYEGRLVDGTVFDSSIERGTPIDLPVGGVIMGWVEGLQLMREGDKFRLYIPTDLAYGDQSPSPKIPANSVLVFDLELLDVKDRPGMEAPAAAEGEAPAATGEAPAAPVEQSAEPQLQGE